MTKQDQGSPRTVGHGRRAVPVMAILDFRISVLRINNTSESADAGMPDRQSSRAGPSSSALLVGGHTRARMSVSHARRFVPQFFRSLHLRPCEENARVCLHEGLRLMA